MGTIVQLASLQTKVAFDENRAAIEHDYARASAQDSAECAHDRLRFFPEAGFRCADCLADVVDWD